MNEETIVISLGGSMIIPDKIDTEFLKEFKKLILSEVKKGRKFIIITGGGKIARVYQEAAKNLSHPSDEDLDWIGISALGLNAELVRVIFEDNAHWEVIHNFSDKLPELVRPILVGAAFAPGHSTDWDSVLAAKNIGAKKVINLSNIDYVYDFDPKLNSNAKKLEKISWSEYRKLIPNAWTSGLNTPFDPTASEEAQQLGIEVIVMNGKPVDNLAKYLNGEKFQGTVIS